jgi:aryl-alcohol dehydrogenase-like predicted oxidoreductase
MKSMFLLPQTGAFSGFNLRYASRMQVQSLGTTDLQVTPMGLGLAALGRPGYINLGHGDDLAHEYDSDAMETHAHAVLDAAWVAGVRYFDAARSYGKAEAFLSAWLQSRGHEDALVGSKWGYTYTADWKIEAKAHEVKEHSLALLNRQVAESASLLQLHLKLYQIHSATLESGVLNNKDVLLRLAELKEMDWCIGLSVSGPQQADVICRALEIQMGGKLLFDTCQATWNVLERSAGVALQEAHDLGMGIIVKEGLANGRLTDRNTVADFSKKRSLLEGLASKHEMSIDAIALAAVLHQPWAGTVLSGAAQSMHLLANLRALDVRLDEDDLEILRGFAESPEVYWKTRSALAWN